MSAGRTTYTEQFKAEVVGEYIAGRVVDAICADYLITRWMLSDWRRSLGATKRSDHPDFDRHRTQRHTSHDEVRRLHSRGMNDRAIGCALEATRWSVRRARIALGLGANFAAGWAWRNRAYRKVKPDHIARLYAHGLSDYAIAKQLHISRTAVREARVGLGLPPNFKKGWPGPGPGPLGKACAAAFALMLFASGARAQIPGWQGHPPADVTDPFAHMTRDYKGNQAQQIDCCHGQDCGFTEECMIDGVLGVLGPGQKCYPLTDEVVRTHNCPGGQTSACFLSGELRCACTGGT